MKKLLILMMFIFFSCFSLVSLAENNAGMSNPPNNVMPLSTIMDQNMKTMATTYLHKVAEDLQLRATDLYAMGEALVSHSNHPQCQAQGQLAIQEAKKLYLISQEILKKEVSSDKMKEFVHDWK